MENYKEISCKDQKQRYSNIELLRCVSIILIMTVHAGYMAFGTPTPEYVRSEPSGSFFYILNQYISVICVDVFVLISGWFGIHAKWKSIGGLIFQCMFFTVGYYVLFFALGRNSFSLSGLYCALMSFPHFVVCYSIMYLFTPVMNAYIENAPPKHIKCFLIIFYVLHFYYGWRGSDFPDFHAGNSAISFMGLYMLARYVKLYTKLPNWPLRKLLMVYLGIVLGTTLVTWGISMSGIADYPARVVISMFPAFSSPTTITSALFLLLVFSKLSFQSKVVNIMGASAFAAVLVHGNGHVFPSLYTSIFKESYQYNDLLIHLLLSGVIIIGIFLLSVLLDQSRLWLWNRILKNIERK